MPVATVLPDDGTLDETTRTDALLGLVTLRYTQSNSVALVRDGAAIGIGAGQQNRVDCVRLAGAKARTWWLRRHPFVDDLPGAGGMGRQDRLNWQIRFAGQEMTARSSQNLSPCSAPRRAAATKMRPGGRSGSPPSAASR